MKIAIAQMRTAEVRYEENLSTVVAHVRDARERGSRAVLFSPDSLGGVAGPPAAFHGPQKAHADRVLGALAEEAQGIAVALCERDPDGTGRRTIVIEDGCIDAGDARAYGNDPLLRDFPRAGWTVQFAQPAYRLPAASARGDAEAQVDGSGRIEVCGVGLCEGEVLCGGSAVLAADGAVRFRASRFEDGLYTVDLDGAASPVEEPPPEELLVAALCRGIRDFVEDAGFSRILVGLSGGIDSAVVAALAARALGPQDVTAVFLPSEFTSARSRDDAQEIAQRLGIEWVEMSIASLHEAARAALPETAEGIVDENLQPRLRTVLLMGLANQRHALVMCTGNKSEIAVGYSTLYGDTVGALAPLGDLYKDEVYRLATTLGDAIPPSVHDRPPSAELRPDQRDDEDLPPYDVLDPILRAILEEGTPRAEILADGYSAALVDSIHERMQRAAYKRAQLPPAIRLRGGTNP